MGLIGRWFRGEPLPGDRDFDLYDRVKRGITREQQLDESSRDFLRGDDHHKKAMERSREADRRRR